MQCLEPCYAALLLCYMNRDWDPCPALAASDVAGMPLLDEHPAN